MANVQYYDVILKPVVTFSAVLVVLLSIPPVILLKRCLQELK